MILLNIQLKLIIFSFIYGFYFAILVKKYNKYIQNKKILYKVFLTFIMMLILDILYFIGIYIISNAILHIYSLISVILGIIFYNLIVKVYKK